MNSLFLTQILVIRKDKADIDRSVKTARALGFLMFAIGDDVYSVENVFLRLEKQYADMSPAIVFKLSDLI